MPALLQVADAFDAAAQVLVVDQGEHVQSLEDPPVGVDCLAERGGVPVALQHPHHVIGADRAGVDGGDQAQDVRPPLADLAQVELPAGRSFRAPQSASRMVRHSFWSGRSASAGRYSLSRSCASPNTGSEYDPVSVTITSARRPSPVPKITSRACRQSRSVPDTIFAPIPNA